MGLEFQDLEFLLLLLLLLPEARVVPTPFRLVRDATACSRFGSFLNAFLLSVMTAFGELIRTKLVNCGKNFPRCVLVREKREKLSQ
jgi:hypothetical protein